VNRMLLKILMTAAASSLLISNATFSQVLPPAKKAAHVEITQGPALEFARDDMAILRWTSNNPGGTDDHLAVVHYGTDPKELTQTAKSNVRLNQGHPETMFRVRLDGLSPRTTYYYTVTSTESNGKSDGVTSPVNHFTTPGAGERVVAYPQPSPQPGTKH
jgi:phosphodiesterase/alkaline phosphatase D-like protein